MQRLKKIWRHSLLPAVLAVLLLAGMIGLLAPATAYAAGGDLTISGPGLNNPAGVTITQAQLRGNEALPPELQVIHGQEYLRQHDEWYSTINTWPTKSWYRGEGVKLSELLELAGGLSPEATQIRFTAKDGFQATFTVQELLVEPRYRFPNFINYDDAPDHLFGHVPGDPSGAVQVETIIAHRSFSAHNLEDVIGPDSEDNFSRGDANHLLYGQRAVTQQTNARFAKYTVGIEVLTSPVLVWDNPTASVEPGEVPVGTLVELHSPFDDEDKVHYTLDGSDPTIESPMYNWIAKRWWSSREQELPEINHPIEITEDTTIKAFVTGPGRADSGIVTFEYTVPGVAVTGVSITEGDQELEEGQTVQLSAVVEPEDATDKSVTWSSSNESVATVSESGLVTAVSAGTAEITVATTDGNFTDSINVNVVPDIPLTVVIKENGVETRTVEYDMNDWETTRQQRYSARDSMPANRLAAAEGVFLEDILEDAGIDVSKITGINFISTDEYVTSMSKSELLDAPRYYYPNIFSSNPEEGAEAVKPMLALKSYVGARNNSTPPSWDSMDYQNTIRLFVGQKNPLDINYSLFAKWICEIEVLLDTQPPAWEQGSELTADVTGSSVTLSWPEATDNTGVTGYHIYQNDVQIDAVTGATQSYTVDGLGPATYTFGVKAADAAGNYSTALTADAIVAPPEPIVLEIIGDGVDNPLQYTMADLENMEQYGQLYSSINSWPTKKWYVAEGVKVRELLGEAGINEHATLIKFTAGDGYSVTFRVEEIYGTQYLFPNFKEGGGDADGHIPGDPSGAEVVEPILALQSANSDNFDDMDNSNALHLIIGQRAVTEQTNEKFAKYVVKIEVLDDPVSKWEEPQASLPSGTVTPGTKIELSTSDMNGDKIYYTTDGSTPTIESTMYNPVAKRWWSSRGAEALAEINRPIEITEDTIIKAIAIGIGKEDSDVVTFEYQVAQPKYAVILAAEPAEGGTVTGAGEYYAGDSVTVEAQAAEGYAFVNWTGAEGEVSTEASYTFNMPAEAVSLTANFEPVSDFVVVDGVLVEYKGAGGDVVIPGDLGITSIGNEVFRELETLTSVIIPEGVTSIGEYAFYKCSNLTAVDIPDSVTSIGKVAFGDCSSLATVTIPEGVTVLADYTFQNCSSLNTVTLPETVTKIGSQAFVFCSSLTSVNIPENVIEIGGNAFYGCSSLADIILPDNLETIGGGAFWACSSLTAITIPGKVTEINTSTFKDCTSLAEVTISEGVTGMYLWAFGGCSSLNKVIIPRSVETINSAFNGCDQLIIYGYRGSFAQSYAATNGIPFVALDPGVSQYAFDYDVPAEIVEGQDVAAAVTFESVEVNDLGYEGVRFKFSAAGPGDVTFTATDSEGVEHTFTNQGYWGPAGGFDLPAEYSATTDWVLNFAQAGDYTVTFSLIDAVTEEVIDGITESVEVTVEPAGSETYSVTFVVTDGEDAVEDAVIEVKDSEGEVVAPEAGGNYMLKAGDYNYTVTKEGFKDVSGTFTVANEAVTVDVVLEAVVDERKIELYEAINEALDLEEEDYTPGTWKSVEGALSTAQTILNLENATQASIDQALARLTAAMAKLAEKADKTALEAAINAAQALNQADYTTRSWRQMSNALATAVSVFQNENAGQEDVDRAEERLNNALNALVEM